MSNKIASHNRIYLFDFLRREKNHNALKTYLLFLKKFNIKEYSFVYSNHLDSLHPHLSIKENFLLDSLPGSIIRHSGHNINEYLYDLKNDALKKLVSYFKDLDIKVNTLSSREIKLICLIKALISKSDFIFLNQPEKYLDDELLNLVKNAISYEAYYNDRIVFIVPETQMLWPEIIDCIIDCKESRFKLSQNPLKDHETEVSSKKNVI